MSALQLARDHRASDSGSERRSCTMHIDHLHLQPLLALFESHMLGSTTISSMSAKATAAQYTCMHRELCRQLSQPPPHQARMHGASEPPQTPVHCACVLKDRKPCKFPPVRDSAFCAHHRLRDPSGAVTRVDCPVDPTQCVVTRHMLSYLFAQPCIACAWEVCMGLTVCGTVRSTVPLAGLRKHLKRCPRAVQLRHQAEQPYYRPGCNDGSGDEVDLGSSIRRHPSERAAGSNGIALNGSDQHAPAAGLPVLRRPPPSSAERAAYAAQLGEAKLRELIARVRRAHAEVRRCFAACSRFRAPTTESVSRIILAAGAVSAAGQRGRAASRGVGRAVALRQPVAPLLAEARSAAGVHSGAHAVLGPGAVRCSPSGTGANSVTCGCADIRLAMVDCGPRILLVPNKRSAWFIVLLLSTDSMQEHSIEQPPCSQQQPYGSAAVTVDCGRGRLPAPDALQSGPSAGSAAERTNAEATFVEFGAGKGYLTALLAECTGARRLVMMDLGAFGLKADRYASYDLTCCTACSCYALKDPRGI